ncbi:hypothetical protein [Klebsiella quasipneumoniae]|uniref:hypothetical protein n=1 Tax=Klebsiella quasipneumoniae TaxID=1463165 RepID=UPI00237E9F93|nr:hypothetical protein [Klebsiella quasipneumoniae]MDL2150080.1 hypothetical protein [Klebsiella quasipneumoniae]
MSLFTLLLKMFKFKSINANGKKEKFYAEFLNLPVDNMSLRSTSRLPLTALTAGPASAQDMPPEIGQA